MAQKLDRSFYLREDTLKISRDLLGKVLVTDFPGENLTAGRITETEAYIAPDDKASHAYNYKKTNRTSIMFMEGGVAYVYLCYGIHAMFNVITHEEGIPHAILIRALEPLEGIKTMLERRGKSKKERTLTAGPGCVSQALGITTRHNAADLLGEEIWIEERKFKVPKSNIKTGPRVGIHYAEEYRNKPWRFKIKDSVWTSKPN